MKNIAILRDKDGVVKTYFDISNRCYLSQIPENYFPPPTVQERCFKNKEAALEQFAKENVDASFTYVDRGPKESTTVAEPVPDEVVDALIKAGSNAPNVPIPASPQGPGQPVSGLLSGIAQVQQKSTRPTASFPFGTYGGLALAQIQQKSTGPTLESVQFELLKRIKAVLKEKNNKNKTLIEARINGFVEGIVLCHPEYKEILDRLVYDLL